MCGRLGVLVMVVVVAALGCGRGKGTGVDAAVDPYVKGARECLAAAPRFRWSGLACESTTPGHPLASPDAVRMPFFVNQVNVRLGPGTTLSQADAIAASVGGRVLKMYYGLGGALLEVPSKTVDEVVAVCRQLKGQPHVEAEIGRASCRERV